MADLKTPIADFIFDYARRENARFHMPGHKGVPILGIEPFDITEIVGADVLCSASGIIEESEKVASELFGTAHSFYSTEGSTLAIKAMLALVASRSGKERPRVLAARNVHKAFVYAAAMLDLDVVWLYPEENTHLCACPVTKEAVKEALSKSESAISAVYLTSPDYLGNLADVKGIATVCRDVGIPLLVDNAHGAYLAFHSENLHPIALGATMSADSAHKTLPVLTGGAYLHIAKDADPYFVNNARSSLAVFASTSPSYLTLASLDLANRYLAEDFCDKYALCLDGIQTLLSRLDALGVSYHRGEPLKITIDAASCGATGVALGEHLRQNGVEAEFCDGDYLVLMVTPENNAADFARLIGAIESFFEKIEKTPDPLRVFPSVFFPTSQMTIRRALLSPAETVPVDQAEGRIAASPTVSCPPAVPIVVSGEVITKEAIELFRYYGIDTVSVVVR